MTKTFEVSYENGHLIDKLIVTGQDIVHAIRAAGLSDAFLMLRVVTWREIA